MSLVDTLERLWCSPTIRVLAPDLAPYLAEARRATHTPVILESPYCDAPPEYVHDCIADSLRRGEAPIASHVLYTTALDDAVWGEREAGISAGFAWRVFAARTVVYTDLGISSGMRFGIEHAESIGQEIVYRSLPEWCTGRADQ